jgi:hypothetical protein
MAHKDAKRQALRAAYVHDHLPLETAADKAGVPHSTAQRWKRQARAAGEDWDKLRAATLLAGEGMENVARQMLADYVVQHKALMDLINTDAELGAAAKVDMLASLADSFNKTVAASRKVLPETNKLATALAVINRLSDFIREHFPQHAVAFVEILEPFGEVLAKE